MSSLTVTVTTPAGHAFVHIADSGGGSIFDNRVVPAAFWRQVADALELPGAPDSVGVCTGDLPTVYGPYPHTFVQRGEVCIRRAVEIGPNHWDYTRSGVDCAIEIVSDYRDVFEDCAPLGASL